MSRCILTLLVALVALVHAQDQPGQLKRDRSQPAASGQQEVPPEEDTSLAVKEYSFNPLQAQKELQIGNFYFKTGKYRSAAMRFTEATKWNEGNSDAWLRLGETEEKLKDSKAAKEAYTRYLALASDAKNAPEIRKKLQKLK
ncbi:MAG: tetratricopeptide repeat protein [Bryobacteraceae bacterium]|jgi:predicted Zn-dependent protease